MISLLTHIVPFAPAHSGGADNLLGLGNDPLQDEREAAVTTMQELRNDGYIVQSSTPVEIGGVTCIAYVLEKDGAS